MSHKTTIALVFLLAFLIGVGLRTLVSAAAPVLPFVVVCESGSFEPVSDPADPYLRERAMCNQGSATGPLVRVLLID